MDVLETNSVAHDVRILIAATSSIGPHNASHFAANSNSIFFVAGSSFAIRKLRTCPALAGSGLEELPLEDAPPFQRAVSMELNDDKSALASARVVFSATCSVCCADCFSGAM